MHTHAYKQSNRQISNYCHAYLQVTHTLVNTSSQAKKLLKLLRTNVHTSRTKGSQHVSKVHISELPPGYTICILPFSFIIIQHHFNSRNATRSIFLLKTYARPMCINSQNLNKIRSFALRARFCALRAPASRYALNFFA